MQPIEQRIAGLEAGIQTLRAGLPYADHGAYGQDRQRISSMCQELAELRQLQAEEAIRCMVEADGRDAGAIWQAVVARDDRLLWRICAAFERGEAGRLEVQRLGYKLASRVHDVAFELAGDRA